MSHSIGNNAPQSIWSCLNCRQKKVRCDRQNPCYICHSSGLECVFPTSGRRPTRQHNPGLSTAPPGKQRILLDRLRMLEQIVQGISRNVQPTTPQSLVSPTLVSGDEVESREDSRRGDVPHHDNSSSDLSDELGRLSIAHGNSLYVNNEFWIVISDELRKCRQEAEENEAEREFESRAQQPPARSVRSSIPFTWQPARQEPSAAQPLPSQVYFIWQIYVENVDPLVKVLHVPTMSAEIRNSRGLFSSMSSSTQALMFCISLAAIASLSSHAVLENFGEDKDQLIERFMLGAEQTLSKVNAFNTNNVKVLQAFLIYLEVIVHRYGSRIIWTMTSMLSRTAISMGLHRDGSRFPSVSVFEAEMRRRLWWHICFLDARVCDCEVAEAALSEDIFDTREPSNIEDGDIYENMETSVHAKEGPTVMTLTLVRCELWRLGRRIRSCLMHLRSSKCTLMEALKGTTKALKQSRLAIKGRLSSNTQSDTPLYNFLDIIAWLGLTGWELVIHQQLQRKSDKLPDQTDHRAFIISMTSLEYALGLHRESSTKQWAWDIYIHFQWLSASIILDHLGSHPWTPVAERAWVAVLEAIEMFPEMIMTYSSHHSLDDFVKAVRSHRDKQLRSIRKYHHITEQLNQCALAHAETMGKLTSSVHSTDTHAAEAQRCLLAELAISNQKDELHLSAVLPTPFECHLNWVAESEESCERSGPSGADDLVDQFAHDWVSLNLDNEWNSFPSNGDLM